MKPDGIWADIGSGTGAFTLALAELLTPAGQIISVDSDRSALRLQQREMKDRFPEAQVLYHEADFTKKLNVPLLDGIVMANSLHFCEEKRRVEVLRLLRSNLKSNGRFILVEYDTDNGNRWVPYPLSFDSWELFARKAGFTSTTLLAIRPSRFLRQIYSAVSTN